MYSRNNATGLEALQVLQYRAVFAPDQLLQTIDLLAQQRIPRISLLALTLDFLNVPDRRSDHDTFAGPLCGAVDVLDICWASESDFEGRQLLAENLYLSVNIVR